MTSPHAPTPAPIPDKYADLIERPLIMSLATTLSDGTPQVTPVWFSYEHGHFFINSAQGRLKDRAIRANPYIAFTVVNPDDPYDWFAVRGPVVEINEDQQVARAHIDQLARRYTGAESYTLSSPSEQRIRYKVAPEHVTGS